MSFDWVVLDTETDGLQKPIRIIEIAAQKMKGFRAFGKPFHIYIDHSVRIPTEVSAIHGITQSFLRKNGYSPHAAHRSLGEYIGDMPYAAHNLQFDLKCINEERHRLGFRNRLSGELCTMLLSRRIIPELKSVKLELLKNHFEIRAKSHRAISDVKILVELFETVFLERLQLLNVNSWQSLKTLSRTSPVARYHGEIAEKLGIEPVPRRKNIALKESPLTKVILSTIDALKKNFF
jgi:DNA polymerase-3 subunit epsilon